MPINRRSVLKLTAGAGAALFLDGLPGTAQRQAQLIRKPIPSSGELIPVIGLGSWRTFNVDPDGRGAEPRRQVVQIFHELGGRLIDTAPSYGRAEAFVADAGRRLGIKEDLFIATKMNVGGAGRAAAVEQMETSARLFGKPSIDLIQVWNLGERPGSAGDRHLTAHLDVVNEWKASGRVRYVGITTSFPVQYPAIEAALRRHVLDFVQLDYSIGDREAEHRLLPLAHEQGVAVLVNRPFSTGSLFSRVANRQLPSWAAEFDAHSWAQLFLKFIVSHPAVTCTIPATSSREHVRDNMGACTGRLPDEAMRHRMIQFFGTL